MSEEASTYRLKGVAQREIYRRRVKSVLDPLVGTSALTGASCFGTACVLRSDRIAVMIMIGIGAVPVLVTCGGGVYFAVFKPEKLQSQDFHE
jgi:hypothetical protein